MNAKKARRRKAGGGSKTRSTKPSADASAGSKKSKKPEPPPDIPRSRRAIAICAVATLVLIGADLYSKELATEHLSTERIGEPIVACEQPGLAGMQNLPDSSYVLIEDYLEFRYAENCGAAFGLLDNAPRLVRRSVFGIAGVAATIFLFVLFVRGSGGRLFAWSVPLIVSGAVGNLVDRARLEYVVDFIYFHVKDQFQYPTFNVADITITVGVALLILDGFVEDRKLKKRPKSTLKSSSDVKAEARRERESRASGTEAE